MVIILSAVESGNNAIRLGFKDSFREMAFGFEPGAEFLDADGFGRREEEATEVKKEIPQNAVVKKINSIDDILLPSGSGSLAELASSTYYNNKKISGIKNGVLDYIFLPSYQIVIAANDNYLSISKNKITIQFAPYSISYKIEIFGKDYDSAREYEPLSEKTIVSYKINSVGYNFQAYNPFFFSQANYAKPANDNYTIFNPKIIQPGIDAADRAFLGFPTKNIGSMTDRIFSNSPSNISYKKDDDKITYAPRASIESILHAEIRFEPVLYSPAPSTTYSTKINPIKTNPAEIITQFSTKNIFNNSIFNNNISLENFVNPANDNNQNQAPSNGNKNPEISDVIVRAFDYNPGQQQADNPQKESYKDNNHEAKNNTAEKAPNSNVVAITKRNEALSAYRQPRRNRRNNSGWKHEATESANIVQYSQVKARILALKSHTKKERRGYRTTSTGINNDNIPNSNQAYAPAENKNPTALKYNANKELSERLQGIGKYFESNYGGKFSYIAVDVPTSEIIAGRNENDMVPVGSMSKIGIVRVLLELSQKGKINLDEEVNVRNSLKPRNYGAVSEDEKITYLSIINEIVKDKYGMSNGSSNAAIDRIGLMRLNKMIKDLGYESTKFSDYYLPRADYRGNQTSMADASRMMLDMLNGVGLDEKHHRIALDALNMPSRIYIIADTKNPDGLEVESVLMKHGQSERDVSVVYRMRGNYEGSNFDRIVAFNLSDLKQRIVKGDYREATSFGSRLIKDFLSNVREDSKRVQMAYNLEKAA